MMFNCTCINNLFPNYLAEKCGWPSQICMRRTRQSSQLNISRCHRAVGQRSFSYPGAKLWNGISDTVKSTDSVNIFTVKRRKPWMAEKFQESWLCSDQSQWSSRRGQTTKPQTNYSCCLWFRLLTPYWLSLRNTKTFHEYFWCSRFCEFHSKRWLVKPQVAQARNMSIGKHRHCCVTFKI